MSEWHERVRAESADLQDKITKLSNYIDTSQHLELPVEHRELLKIQLEKMRDYRDTLDERVAKFA